MLGTEDSNSVLQKPPRAMKGSERRQPASFIHLNSAMCMCAQSVDTPTTGGQCFCCQSVHPQGSF